MSAIAHLFVATIYRNRYKANLKYGINKVRWIEYALSASTMMVGIALLSGVYDLASLVMIFGLTAVMNLMGLAMEIYNRGREKVYIILSLLAKSALAWQVFAGTLRP